MNITLILNSQNIMHSLLKGACYNKFQLFNSKEEAQALKDIVKSHFAPKLIYRVQQQSAQRLHNRTPRASNPTLTNISKSASNLSLLQTTFTSQCNINPIVLKKKEVLLKKINPTQLEKVKKAVAKARGETQTINLKMRYTHIPLKPSEEMSVKCCSKPSTAHSTSATLSHVSTPATSHSTRIDFESRRRYFETRKKPRMSALLD